MTYAILQVSAAAYAEIRGRIVAIDDKLRIGPVYQSEYIRPADRFRPEHIVLGTVGLEALAAPVMSPAQQALRDSMEREREGVLVECVARAMETELQRQEVCIFDRGGDGHRLGVEGHVDMLALARAARGDLPPPQAGEQG